MRRLLVIPILLIEALLALVAGKAAVAKGVAVYVRRLTGTSKNEGVLGLLLTTIVAGNVRSNGTIVLLESGATVEGNINSDI